jgi:hypothetical protein
MYFEELDALLANITKKKCNQLMLKNSVNHIDFTFEKAIDEAETYLKNRLTELKSELEIAHDNYDSKAYGSDGLMNDSHEVEETLALVFDLESDVDMNEQQLYCFAEMRIVHLFRAYEITLKKLIKIASPSANERDFFNWEKLREFCKSNGFNIKSIPSYSKINQLRLVNNCIKHSANINDDVKKHVPDFLSEGAFTYQNLYDFYNSVRDHLLIFLQGVALEFESSLYEHSEDKLNKIVNDYRKVMDSRELKLLSEKINHASKQNDKATILDSLSIYAVTK